MSVKIETLKRNKNFNITYSKGSSCVSKHIVLIYLKRRDDGVKFGFVASKKIGGAVQRNKVRRRMKEAVRTKIQLPEGNWNLIFVARKGITDASFKEICGDIKYLLKKAGL